MKIFTVEPKSDEAKDQLDYSEFVDDELKALIKLSESH